MRFDSTSRRELRWTLTTVALLTLINPAHAADDAKGLQFFESKIRPILVDRCYNCHSAGAKKIKGGLLLDSRDRIRKGGESGHAVIPNNVADSLLISAIRHEDYEMPPNGKLPDVVIADFEKWVEMGAPDPRDGTAQAIASEIDIEAGREFWAFQPPQAADIPHVNRQDWPKDDIDRFVLARMEQHGLKPVAAADKKTLLRRVTLDLIGLPPTREEIESFVNDTSDDAFERVVDRLLDSKHFGERWGRHWLDVVRYAESIGKTRNFPFPFAWRYRDYVIDAFNNDKPYDQFIREQIAGDLLPADSDELKNQQSIATGFLALGSHDLNARKFDLFTMDVVGEQIDTVSRAFMSLTVGCARCHDHKFDPIPTSDYYAMAGIFRSSELLNGYMARARNNEYSKPERFIRLAGFKDTAPASDAPEPAEVKADTATQKLNDRVAQIEGEVKQLQKELRKLNKNKQLTGQEKQAKQQELRQTRRKRQQQLNKLRARLKKSNRRGQLKLPSYPVSMGVADASTPENCRINIRGDATRLGPEVPRGFLQVVAAGEFPIDNQSSGRLELAEWLASAENPLTARVMVNRVWQHLFGRGIVRTCDNFGQMGARPTHPELLDHLALRFVNNGWSVKSLVRSIVLSRSYALSSKFDEANYVIDGDNAYVWRMTPARLEVEVIRDSILAASGQLNREPLKGSPVQNFNLGEIGRANNAVRDSNHRSIYLPIIRSKLPAFMTVFDFPDSSEVRGQRDVTTVPTQALYLMNSPFVLNQASIAAKNLVEQTTDDRERIDVAYQQTLGRNPTDAETQRLVEYVNSVQEEIATNDRQKNNNQSTNRRRNQRRNRNNFVAKRNPWTDVYHALFASAEFRYRP